MAAFFSALYFIAVSASASPSETTLLYHMSTAPPAETTTTHVTTSTSTSTSTHTSSSTKTSTSTKTTTSTPVAPLDTTVHTADSTISVSNDNGTTLGALYDGNTTTIDFVTNVPTKQPLEAVATIVIASEFESALETTQLQRVTDHFCDSMASSLGVSVHAIFCTATETSGSTRHLRTNLYQSFGRRNLGTVMYEFTAFLVSEVVDQIEAAAEGTEDADKPLSERLSAFAHSALISFETAVSTDSVITAIVTSVEVESVNIDSMLLMSTLGTTLMLQGGGVQNLEMGLPAATIVGVIFAVVISILAVVAVVIAIILVRRNLEKEHISPSSEDSLPTLNTSTSALKQSQLAKAYASAETQSASPKGMEMRQVRATLNSSSSGRHSAGNIRPELPTANTDSKSSQANVPN